MAEYWVWLAFTTETPIHDASRHRVTARALFYLDRIMNVGRVRK